MPVHPDSKEFHTEDLGDLRKAMFSLADQMGRHDLISDAIVAFTEEVLDKLWGILHMS